MQRTTLPPASLDSHTTLVQTASNELTPMHTLRPYSARDIVLTILFFLVVFSLLGLLVWLTVDISHRSQLVCEPATVEDAGEYHKLSNRSADVYNGNVAKAMKGDLAACQAECKMSDDLGADCSFFTKTDTGCNLYTQGIMTEQNANTALVGPTQLAEDVYVKKSYRFIQLVGLFHSEATA
jgi:hypothetical protein